MSYSSYGFMALLVYLIIDRDVLFARDVELTTPALRSYRNFLLSVMCYIETDILWGLLDQLGLVTLLYVDTVVYYVAMAASVLLWTRYVITYLDERHAFQVALRWAGNVFFAALLTVSAVNLFSPILFWFDEHGAYHAEIMRHVFLVVQMLLFLLTALYTLVMSHRSGPAARRERAIGLFGVAMGALVVAQYVYPLLPLYSAGCLLGGCVLHSFVVEDEREEHLGHVEEMLARERRHKHELEQAIQLANTDPLTGLGSKRAYADVEERLEYQIVEGTAKGFAIVIMDLNGLKHVNDTRGHEAGDKYILEACVLIREHFPHSPVFRIGGDEFVVLLEGTDYRAREELAAAFDKRMEQDVASEGPVISMGMATFDAQAHRSYHAVFAQADRLMYERKQELKRMGAHVRA